MKLTREQRIISIGVATCIVLVLLINIAEKENENADAREEGGHLYLPPLKSLDWVQTKQILDAIQIHDHKCKKVVPKGGMRKGGGYWRVCFDNLKTPCTVYSFGINRDFSFDKDMAEFGCNVYSFDPSTHKQNVTRGERLQLYNIGLSNTNADDVPSVAESGEQGNWDVRTLDRLMNWFHHDRIDVLKLDIEGIEWRVFKQMAKAGTFDKVDQLLVEIHFWGRHTPDLHKQWYNTIMLLKSKGFKVFDSRESAAGSKEYMGDPSGEPTPCCWEVFMVK